ncbi:Protein BNI4 [Ceratocystis lukuohia]
MSQNHRNSFHAHGAMPLNMQPVYRPAVAPIQPYAFTSTPSLNTNTSQRLPTSAAHMQRPSQTSSPRPTDASRSRASQSHSVHSQAPPQAQNAWRPQPDRYRRGSTSGQQNSRVVSSASPSGIINLMSPNGNLYHHHNTSDTRVSALHKRGSSADMSSQTNAATALDDVKRLRRRSIQTLDYTEYQNMAPPALSDLRRASDSEAGKSWHKEQGRGLRLVAPVDQRARSSSFESAVSNHSSTSSNNRSGPSQTRSNDNDKPELSIPPRGSSNIDGSKRTSSPLCGNVTSGKTGSSTKGKDSATTALSNKTNNSVSSPVTTSNKSARATTSTNDSPAAQKLAAISQGGKSKTKTSRLRRAFSFGSVTEFRRAAALTTQNQQTPLNRDISTPDDKSHIVTIPRPQTATGMLRSQPSLENVDEAEQERIAKKQEASGLGNNIYGPRIFGGSTDNLSISSTASSASMMIRKMGRGMKRGSRSFIGLFRPKSVVGGQAEESTGVAEITMVNAEADRSSSGMPLPNRIAEEPTRTPSLTSDRAGSSGTDSSNARKNVDASGQPRGILKRHNPSPPRNNADVENGGLVLPEIPRISDSPNSSAPSTPNDDAHRRVGSVAIGNEDYFVTALKLRQDGNGSMAPRQTLKRNATFSPRIVFYDTWPSQEYDRRGEIATCNRLTPLLAQQIKEELNNFKMEMQVHETSKIYTHFF